jgi:hypothetical protein
VNDKLYEGSIVKQLENKIDDEEIKKVSVDEATFNEVVDLSIKSIIKNTSLSKKVKRKDLKT